jgi:KaiC/GvpD/RAD55 family RecA-like ATPase
MCALETRDRRIRALILREAPVEDFGSDEGKEVRGRIDDLFELGKPLARCIEFSDDPTLSKLAAAFIHGGNTKKRKKAREFDREQVQVLVNTLHEHRRARILKDGLARISHLSSDRLGLKIQREIRTLLEEMLLNMVEDPSRKEIIHYGSRADVNELKEMVERITTFNPKAFISTGIKALDDHLKGWERGSLVTFSAQPGDGKSTLAIDSAVNQYLEGQHNVCFVSLEMPHEQLERRMSAKLTGIPHSVVRYAKDMTSEQKEQIGEVWKKFYKFGRKNNCNFTIRDVAQGEYTPKILETELAPLMYDVIVIDYLTLFDLKGMETWRAVLEYSRYLKLLAQRLQCVIISLTQLSEKGDPKYGKAIKDNTDYWLKWVQERNDEGLGTGDALFELAKSRHERTIKFPGKLNFEEMTIETQDPQAIGVSAVRIRQKQEERKYEEQVGTW